MNAKGAGLPEDDEMARTKTDTLAGPRAIMTKGTRDSAMATTAKDAQASPRASGARSWQRVPRPAQPARGPDVAGPGEPEGVGGGERCPNN